MMKDVPMSTATMDLETGDLPRERKGVFRTLFDCAAVGIAQISLRGRFLRVNPAMCAMFGRSTDEFSRLTIRDVVHPDDVTVVKRQADRLRKREADMFSMDSRGVTESGEIKWLHLTVTAVRDDSGRAQYFETIAEDISRRKAAEDDLQRLMADLERQVEGRTRAVKTLQEITVIANESNDVAEALRRTLDRICTQLGWPVGHALLAKPDDPETFVDADIWCVEAPERYGAFVEASRKTAFRAGPGFIGRVIQMGRPYWIPDVLDGRLFLRARVIHGCGVRAAFAFPILICEQVVGVLEFFACEKSELQPELVDGLAEIGTQLGRVVERRSLERQIADATAHEQRVLGRNLHDSVVQELTGLGMLAERLRIDLHAEGSPSESRAAAIGDGLSRLQKQVRQISHGLMPVDVDPRGLMSALQKLADASAALHGVTCRFVCPRPVFVENCLRANELYRIAQEAVQNAARHGRPSQITIRLAHHSPTATLSVIDDGRGFEGDPDDVGGIGFRIMRHRAGVVDGRLRISSTLNEGTTVQCTFPTSA